MDTKKISLSVKIIATSLLISLTLITVIEIKNHWDFQYLMAQKDKELVEKGLDVVSQVFSNNYDTMSLVMAQVLANDAVMEAFARRDRELLLSLTSPVWDQMQTRGIYQYYFHLPEEKTFLRVHMPDHHSDDYSKKRPMLVDAGRYRIALEGMEEGVYGVSFRSVCPAYFREEFIGFVELGMVLDTKRLNYFKSINGGEWFLGAVGEDEITILLGTRRGDYQPVLDPQLIAEFQDKGTGLLEQGTMQTQIILLKDYSGNFSWVLAGQYDHSQMLATRREQGNSNLLFAFSLAAIGLLIMSFMLRRLLRPLSFLVEHTRALAHGDYHNPIPIIREDEIGKLAMAMEAMRKALHKKDAELTYTSLHDQLTALYNRTFFEQAATAQEEQGNYPVSIITTDMDGLKLINDTMGHAQGDNLLKSCAAVLTSCLRDGDLLARIGGDEFAAILPKTDEDTANRIVAAFCAAIDDYNHEHPQLPISVSLGVSTTTGPEKSMDETFKEADSRMYKDKLYRSASARGQIVSALLAALAERDYVAEGHADRMQELSQIMAERVGLPANQLSDLILLAKVHDLGKVGIPDHILFKPGKLNDSEWEIMKQHPEKGYRIAQASPDLLAVASLILRHHEKWDGTGYPLRLKGEDIPIECRILSIVDAYDAMTNDRPYQKAKTKAEALAEIRRNAGTQFDPALVHIFVQILEEEDNQQEQA